MPGKPGHARGRARGHRRSDPDEQQPARRPGQPPGPAEDVPVQEMASMGIGQPHGEESVYQRQAENVDQGQVEVVYQRRAENVGQGQSKVAYQAGTVGQGQLEVVYQRQAENVSQAQGGARPKTQFASPAAASSRGRGNGLLMGRSSDVNGREGEDQGKGLERRQRFVDPETRPKHIQDTRGISGRVITLQTNYFSVDFPSNLLLYQYHVDYNPPCDSKKLKIALLLVHKDLIGNVHIFDGGMLFLPKRLPNLETEVFSNRQFDNAQIRITIKLTNEVPPNHPTCIQVFNILFRRSLRTLGMTQVQRHYFDFNSKIHIPKHRLQVIPGIDASILPYENRVLLNVDVAHKLIRTDTVLDVMYEEYNKRQNQDDIVRRMLGSVVMTRYNNRTYKVDDIDFDLRITDNFKLSNGTEVSYKDYFLQHYNETVTDPDQPLLVSKPSTKDRNRGQTSNTYLIPEFCILTGLTDDMRNDFQLMKDVAIHTRISPNERIERLSAFRGRLNQNEDVKQELNNWALNFSQKLVELRGRILPAEVVYQHKNVQLNYQQSKAEWSGDMRGKKLMTPVSLSDWNVYFTTRCSGNARDLVQTLSRVGPPLGMAFSEPQMIDLRDDRNETYMNALKATIKPTTQLVLCVVTNNKKDRYDAIKKLCVCEMPVPSQVVVQRTLMKKQMLMSISTKIAIQLNCKLGGDAWAVEIPLSNSFMVVGIDTYHDSSVKNRSVAGVVFSLNRNCTRYYSRVTFQESHVELVNGLTTVCTAALRKYNEVNHCLPEKIYIYRDGVGDGQLDAVFTHEMPQVMNSFRFAEDEKYRPRIAFIVVKKRIGSRFFISDQSGATNPPPGTIVDTEVTKKEWYDFFLISQSVRQGTVTPTHYNVIWDDTRLKPDHMQRLAYKMTHLYYNWPGTIRVPAPCQYAHKLAFLTGQSLHREPDLHMSDKLFYL